MTIIATYPNGKVLAENSNTITVPIGGGDIAITLSFPELKKIEAVKNIRFDTDPPVYPGEPMNYKIDKNVVGCTLYGVAAGTTLTYKMEVEGW